MNLLIQRTKAFGDIVMMEPILDYLAKNDHKVTLITSEQGREILEGREFRNLKFVTKKPYFRHFLRKVFRNIIRMKYEQHPQILSQAGYAEVLNLKNFKPRRPRLSYSSSRLLSKLSKPYVLLHNETASPLNYRKIYGVDWKKVMDYFNELGYTNYLIEDNSLKNKNGKILARLTINDLKAVTAKSNLFIGNDSFPSHVAVAFNIPSIIFFGAIDPTLRHPDLSNVTVISNDCEFSGCYHNPKYFNKLGKTICPIVGEEGIPPCCVHSSDKIIEQIESTLRLKKVI